MTGLIFTFALTYGGAVLSLFRPFHGLLIYIAFSILRPEALWHWSVPQGGNYSRIVAIALLIGWALNGFGNWNLSRGRAMLVLFAGFWAWAALSTVFAALFLQIGTKYLEEMAKILLPFMVGLSVINSIDQVKQLAWTICLSVSYVAYEMNLAYYDGFNFLHEYGFGGMDNNCHAIQLVSAVGLMFFLGFTAKNWWQRLIAAGGILVMINAVMFSFSRGGLLALIVTGGVAFLLIPRRPVHYLALAGAVLVGIRLAGKEVTDRFMTSFVDKEVRDTSAESRLELWADCWQLMQQHPIFGVGPNHFPHYAQYYLGWGTPKEAHSLWFQTGAELGFTGVGLLIGFYLLCIWRLWPLTRESYPTTEPRIRDLARMVIASLAGFLVASQFVSLEGLELPYYVVLIGACTLKVAPQHALAWFPYPQLAPQLLPAPAAT